MIAQCPDKPEAKTRVIEELNKFKTMDGCYFNYADEIEENVTAYYNAIKEINSDLKTANKNAAIIKEFFLP